MMVQDLAVWTEADQAYADFVSEIACEVSEDEYRVYTILGALEERGLFSVSEAVKLILSTPPGDAQNSASGEK